MIMIVALLMNDWDDWVLIMKEMKLNKMMKMKCKVMMTEHL